jgi:hypothetical protein
MIRYGKTRQSEIYRGFPGTLYATSNVSYQIGHNRCLSQEDDQQTINSERKILQRAVLLPLLG